MESPLPSGWAAYNTEAGQVYYHNAAQKLTQWDRPMSQTTSSTPVDVIGQPTFTNLAGTGVPGGKVNAKGGETHAPDVGAVAIKEFTSQALRYFDVTTDEIKARLIAASLPYRLLEGQTDHDMVEQMEQKPDFYGPFWICMTASLALFAGSHLYCWASNRFLETYYSEFYVATITTFAFWLAVPICLRITALWNAVEPQLFKLAHLICIFGYSFWPIVPMCLLCGVPSKFLQLIFVVLALMMSITYVLVHMFRELAQVDKPLRFVFLGIFVVAHLIYYALMPSYFFHLPTAIVFSKSPASIQTAVESGAAPAGALGTAAVAAHPKP